jgi:hypothetical protein
MRLASLALLVLIACLGAFSGCHRDPAGDFTPAARKDRLREIEADIAREKAFWAEEAAKYQARRRLGLGVFPGELPVYPWQRPETLPRIHAHRSTWAVETCLKQAAAENLPDGSAHDWLRSRRATQIWCHDALKRRYTPEEVMRELEIMRAREAALPPGAG